VDWSVTELLWLCAGVAAFLVCLPMILGALGCTRFVARARCSPAECAPADDVEYQFYHDQLRNLGFEPLGVLKETGYFYGFHYAKTFRLRVFAHRELGVYATVYRLIPGDALRVSLSTLLADGWLVQTGCWMESLISVGEKYYRWGVTTRVVREQLEAHQEVLRSRWEEGVVLAPIDLAALARRSKEVSQQQLGGRFRQHALEPLGLALFVLASLTALGWAVSGAWPLLAPGGLLLGSLIYHPLMTFLMRWVAREIRREDAAKESGSLDTPLRSVGATDASGKREGAFQPERAARRGPEHIRAEGGVQSGQ
jgi:hypothetical protein